MEKVAIIAISLRILWLLQIAKESHAMKISKSRRIDGIGVDRIKSILYFGGQIKDGFGLITTWNWGKIDDGKINDDLFVENARTQTIDFMISFTNFLLQNKRCKRDRAVTPNWDTQSHRPLYHSLN